MILMYKKFLFIIFALIVYRLGVFVPIPISAFVKDFSSSFEKGPMDFINTFSGGALYRLGIFGLNVMPYITASIVLQLLSSTIPFLVEIKSDGSSGMVRIAYYTKYLTLLLALVQSYFFCSSISNSSEVSTIFLVASILSMASGCVALMWIGQFISSFGFSNGVSILIFINILSSFPSSFASLFKLVFEGVYSQWVLVFIVLLSFSIVYFVCFFEKSFRKVYLGSSNPTYAKISSATDSFLPLKLNMTGVIPPIFANSTVMLPIMLLSYFGYSSTFFAGGSLIYILVYSILIVFFSYFYAGVVIDVEELSKNLKRSNHFVPGIRPGESTKIYISKIINILTFFGSIYLVVVCVIPEFLISKYSIPFAFGGATILILVNVAMDIFTRIYLVHKDCYNLSKTSKRVSMRKSFIPR